MTKSKVFKFSLCVSFVLLVALLIPFVSYSSFSAFAYEEINVLPNSWNITLTTENNVSHTVIDQSLGLVPGDSYIFDITVGETNYRIDLVAEYFNTIAGITSSDSEDCVMLYSPDTPGDFAISIPGTGLLFYVGDNTVFTSNGSIIFAENEAFVLIGAESIASDLYVSFNALYHVIPDPPIPSLSDNLASIMRDGVDFGVSFISESVSHIFSILFVDSDGNLSQYATYTVWFSAVAVALGFFKYILTYLLSLGNKK